MKLSINFLIGTSILVVALLAGLGMNLEDNPAVQEDSSEFTFARLVYSGGNFRGSSWRTDYPKADRQFLYALRKLTDFSFIGRDNRTIPIMSEELF